LQRRGRPRPHPPRTLEHDLTPEVEAYLVAIRERYLARPATACGSPPSAPPDLSLKRIGELALAMGAEAWLHHVTARPRTALAPSIAPTLIVDPLGG
jgi:hypothetical protein